MDKRGQVLGYRVAVPTVFGSAYVHRSGQRLAALWAYAAPIGRAEAHRLLADWLDTGDEGHVVRVVMKKRAHVWVIRQSAYGQDHHYNVAAGWFISVRHATRFETLEAAREARAPLAEHPSFAAQGKLRIFRRRA